MDAAAAARSLRHDLCGEDPWQPEKVSDDDEGEMRGDSRGPALAFVSGADCRMQAALESLEGKSRMLLNDG